jgi:hypothetical protein
MLSSKLKSLPNGDFFLVGGWDGYFEPWPVWFPILFELNHFPVKEDIPCHILKMF